MVQRHLNTYGRQWSLVLISEPSKARAVAQPWCSTSERTHFSVARLPIFDGHNGKDAAQYVCDNLPRVIMEDDDLSLELKKGTPCGEEFTPKNCEMLCNNTKLDLATVKTDVDEKVEDKVCSYVDQLLAAMRAKDSTMHVHRRREGHVLADLNLYKR